MSQENSNSILKQKSSSSLDNISKKKVRIQWDEASLAKTDAEKQKYSHIKITEPKTPFIHYDQQTDTILGASAAKLMPIFNLQQKTKEDDLDDEVVGNKESMQVDPSSFHAVDSFVQSGNSSKEWDSTSEDETGDEEERKKKKEFAKMRAQHYNMKEAFTIAKQLIATDDEADGDEDE